MKNPFAFYGIIAVISIIGAFLGGVFTGTMNEQSHVFAQGKAFAYVQADSVLTIEVNRWAKSLSRDIADSTVAEGVRGEIADYKNRIMNSIADAINLPDTTEIDAKMVEKYRNSK